MNESRETANANPHAWVKQLPGLAWRSDADGRSFATSAGWCAYTSRRDDWLNVVHAEDQPETRTLWRQALASGSGFEDEHRLRHHDGVYRWFRASVMPLRDAAGVIQGWLGVHVDIHTWRTRSVHPVADSARIEHLTSQFRNSQRVAGVGSFELDASTGETVWSDELFRIMGVDPLEGPPRYVAGVPLPTILQESWDRLEVALARTMREAVGYEVLMEGRLPSGDTTHLIARGEPLVDVSGNVLRIVGTVQDVTEREQVARQLRTLSEQAESANRAKSEFLANVSHDLRTPLAAITGMSYLLARTPLDEEQRAQLATIERASKGLALMVNDILDLSKIEANQLALEVQTFSIASVLDELRGLMTGFALGKPLELVIEAEPSRVTMLSGDRVRLLQVLTNLLSNAIKFTEQGSVQLRVREVGARLDVLLARGETAHFDTRWLRFEVEDSGPGIDERSKAGLFERFQRLDNASSRNVSGTGLGLAIVRQLSTRMGGHVGVDSELGVGSTFWCELPFEVAAGLQPDAEGAFQVSLLIVDASEPQRLAIASSARGLGWTAVTAGSVSEARTLLGQRVREERPIDIVVLDRKQPFSEVCAALDERALRRRPSVVLLSAQDGERDSLLAPLAQVVIGKPVTPNVLRSAVTRALTARWSTRPPSSQRSSRPLSVKRLLTVRALVVDDNDVNRDIARRILELEGAEVELAANGAGALERSAACEFDVVLMDVQLPGMDGSEVVRRMRAFGAKVPVVALTAGALASDRMRALAAGMNAFIAKPFEPEALIHTVRELVEQARGSALPTEARSEPPVEALAWPALDGIDGEESERRLRGDRELFRALLTRVLDELESFLQAPPELNRLAPTLHRLRGMTGNIGARVIAKQLAAVERALIRGDGASVRAELELLPREVRRVRDGARDFLVATNRAPTSSLPHHELAPRVDALIELLRAQDLEALPLLDELTSSLTQALGDERCHALHDAVERLDFALAAELLTNEGSG